MKSMASISRRNCLNLIAGAGAAGAVAAASSGRERRPIRAVAFDAFPILDPRPIFALAEDLFPGHGRALGDAWKTRQFEYQWLRALAGRYADFRQATEDALIYAAASLKLDMTAEKRERLMAAYLELRAWPDAPPTLARLKEAGIRLAFLSNATPAILEAGIANSGLAGVFEHVLSTDRIRTYKPDPRAYRMATDAFGLRTEEVAFAAFAGWDAAGAAWFGFPTYWANRLGAPVEELGVRPHAEGRDLSGLAEFVLGRG